MRSSSATEVRLRCPPERLWIAWSAWPGEAQLADHLVDAAGALVGADVVGEAQLGGVPERAADGELRMQDVVLRDEPDALAELVVVGVEVAARVLDAALVGRPEPRQRLEQRRLARSAGPDDREQALRLQAEPDAVEELLALRGPHDDALGAEPDVAGVDVLDEPVALEVQEHMPDPDDVVSPDLLPPDSLPVDEGAVGAVQVGDEPPLAVADQLGVLPRGQQVRDDDVVALVAADGESLRGGPQVVDRGQLPLTSRPLRRRRDAPLLRDHRRRGGRAQHRRRAGEEFDDGCGGVAPEADPDGAADGFAGEAAVADEGAVAALVDDLPPERADPHDEVAARDLRPEDLEVARLVPADDELGAGSCHAPVSAGADFECARRRLPALAGFLDLGHELPLENRVLRDPVFTQYFSRRAWCPDRRASVEVEYPCRLSEFGAGCSSVEIGGEWSR